jgi:hypothetical protein
LLTQARKRLLRKGQVSRWPSIIRSANAAPSLVWKSPAALATLSRTSALITLGGLWPEHGRYSWLCVDRHVD